MAHNAVLPRSNEPVINLKTGMANKSWYYYWDQAERRLSGDLYTNNSLIKADTAGSPVAFTVGERRLVGRITGGTIDDITTSSALDFVGSTRGSVLYRGATDWSILVPGTVNHAIVSAGAGADPAYAAIVNALTGTANKVEVSASTGSVIVTLPTAITLTGHTVTGGTFAAPAITGFLDIGTATKSAAAPADSTVLGYQARYTTASSSTNKITHLNFMEQSAATTGAAIVQYNHLEVSASSGTVAITTVQANYLRHSGASTLTTAKGVSSQVIQTAGTVSSFYNFFAGTPDISGGTLTAQYAFYAQVMTGAGTKWGVYIDDTTAMNYFGGEVAIKTLTPAASAALDIGGNDGALLIPRLTTAERDALTAVNGMIVYNSTLGKFQGYEAGAWTSFI